MIQAKLKMCAGCDTLKHIWKNVKGKKYCKDCCNSGKILEKEDVTKVFIKVDGFLKLKPIKKISEKKKTADAKYTILRKNFLEQEENSNCYAQLPNICIGGFKQQLTIHHKSGRMSQKYLDTSTWISLCMSCHHWVETHPKEAREKGLSDTKH